jgi:GTP-binding protein EngB required for normal cell division
MRFPFLRRKAAKPPVLVEPEYTGPPAETVSRILKDVLSASPASGPQDKPSASETDQVPLSRRLSVGARLDETKKRVLDVARTLIAHADRETAQSISLVAEQLRKQACRVAFVGQVKAGKSSLINVLVEQPDLLPSDINPCTAVITRLSFGVPDKPQSGAQFTFFSREEWRRLSLGGRTRELTDRLFPDFDWEVLRSQVRQMEERARVKLGNSFEDLMGKEHLYHEIQPDLLVRYIGAEHPQAESQPERTEGMFSDITKTADIYLDLGAFSFPTILIDTPGVNDPFLVRDEITRQNLETADICVVVVTARQPLSATDLNLLRMLRGLKKDRLIIFINKVDEVKGGDDILKEIGRQVTATLKQEFPGSHIPVVFGSAAYAHKALNRHEPEYKDDEAIGFHWPSQSDIAGRAKAEAFFLRSGLLSLAVAVSEMMSTGPIADSIGVATRLIDVVGHNLAAWFEIEASLLRRLPDDAGRVRGDLDAIIALRHELAARFDAFVDKLDTLRDEEVSLIKQMLSAKVQAFIPETLTSLQNGELAAQASQIDVKLRMRLELAFQDAIADTCQMLASEQEAIKDELTARLEACGLPGKPAIVLGQPLCLTPSLAALSEPAALGFAAHLSRMAGTRAGGPGASAVDLADLIVADFVPILEKLGEEASKVFREGVLNFAKQAKALTFGPMDLVIGRMSLALNDAQTAQHEETETSIQTIRQTVLSLKPILEARHTGGH